MSLYCSLDARDSISVQLASDGGLADSEFESIMEDHQETVKREDHFLWLMMGADDTSCSGTTASAASNCAIRNALL